MSLQLRASRDVETGLTIALGGVAAALWPAGRPEDAIALFAAFIRAIGVKSPCEPGPAASVRCRAGLTVLLDLPRSCPGLRLAARNPAHEADGTLHLPLRRRFQAEAQAAVTKTAAARARQRLAALDTP
jgi:hypothetical protein